MLKHGVVILIYSLFIQHTYKTVLSEKRYDLGHSFTLLQSLWQMLWNFYNLGQVCVVFIFAAKLEAFFEVGFLKKNLEK